MLDQLKTAFKLKDYRYMVSTLKTYRDQGHTLQVKLNATKAVLLDELARIIDELSADTAPEIDYQNRETSQTFRIVKTNLEQRLTELAGQPVGQPTETRVIDTWRRDTYELYNSGKLMVYHYPTTAKVVYIYPKVDRSGCDTVVLNGRVIQALPVGFWDGLDGWLPGRTASYLRCAGYVHNEAYLACSLPDYSLTFAKVTHLTQAHLAGLSTQEIKSGVTQKQKEDKAKTLSLTWAKKWLAGLELKHQVEDGDIWCDVIHNNEVILGFEARLNIGQEYPNYQWCEDMGAKLGGVFSDNATEYIIENLTQRITSISLGHIDIKACLEALKGA